MVSVSNKRIYIFSSSSTISFGLSKSQSSLIKQNLYHCMYYSEIMHLNISLELESEKFVQLIILIFEQINIYCILDNKIFNYYLGYYLQLHNSSSDKN